MTLCLSPIPKNSIRFIIIYNGTISYIKCRKSVIYIGKYIIISIKASLKQRVIEQMNNIIQLGK